MLFAKDLALTKRDYLFFGIGSLILLLCNLLSSGNPFFWDNLHNSAVATYYFDSGFATIVPPQHLDAGHTPGFNLFLAIGWKIFGRHLWVGHLLMLPFVLGIAYQVFILTRRLLPENVRDFAFILALCEPTLLAQSTMVSPEIPLAFAWLLGINAILNRKHIWLLPASVLMMAVTFRGVLSLAPLFILDFVLAYLRSEVKPMLKRLYYYLPAATLVIVWLVVHYSATGSILAGAGTEYEEHRKLLGISAMIKNIGIVGWRFLDFGRIGIWIFLVAIALWKLKKKQVANATEVKLALSILIPAVGLALFFVPFSNPIGHRYFLVSYILIAVLAGHFLGEIKNHAPRIIAGVSLFAVLLTGHLWIYPDRIAKGWDSTLGHVPYFHLKEEMLDFCNEQGILLEDICVDFPTSYGPALARLEGGLEHPFSSVHDGGLMSCRYVMHSNINNGFSDADLSALKHDWDLQKEVSFGGIYIRLYAHHN